MVASAAKRRLSSQRLRILQALKAGRAVTPEWALAHLGCYRLGARIHELRQEGWPIESRLVQRDDGSRFAEYRLAHRSPAQRRLWS